MTGLPRVIASTLSFRLMEMACHPSYPLNSENASPPGTFTLYLSCFCCAEMARPPKRASHTAAIPMVSLLMRFIAAPRVVSMGVAPDWVAVPAQSRAQKPAATAVDDGLDKRGRAETIGRWYRSITASNLSNEC